jgi:hypothetical protein
MSRVVVLAALGFLPFTACGGQTDETDGAAVCPELCAEAKSKNCPMAPQIPSCDDFCLGEDARAEGTGCKAKYDAAETCIAKQKDICAAPAACASEILAADSCESAYCMGHPDADVCVAPAQ